MRTIFHLDLDAFFISVERILDPRLEGKPVIVGSDPAAGRGVVSACSYEARRYGLSSGMPISQAFRLCPGGVYLHGHHREYGHYSDAVRRILEKFAPAIEQASIDEFYMDFTGCEKIYGNFPGFASRLQKTIYSQLHLPCSIGIASNRTVAKVATDCLKPKGITYVLPGMEKEFLRPMPVEVLPGVGKVTLKQLHAKGFYTVGDVAKASPEYFSLIWGACGTDIWEKSQGRGRDFISVQHERKSISKEHTFGTDTVDKKIIEEKLFVLCGKVCQLMRDKGWQTSNVSIKFRYADFTTLTRARKTEPTGDDKTIFSIARELFRSNFTRRVGIRLIGIHLSRFSEHSEQQLLFDDEETRRRNMLDAVDMLRGKYGYSSISVGSA
ncbi:MAG: DNA polymerase IV [Bacteroidota bacterium]